MKSLKIFVLLAGLAMTWMGNAQPSMVAPKTLSESWDMPSPQGPYRIAIVRTEKVPIEGYRVLYVLDGNAFLPLFQQQARLLAGREMSDTFLIVGIGYPTEDLFDVKRRMRDDTPKWLNPVSAEAMHINPAITGDDREFSRFLQEKLLPEIAKRYKVRGNESTLFGHSLGGLFVLNEAAHESMDFKHYFAASPSLWWNDGATGDDLYKQLERMAHTNKLPDIYTTVGNEEELTSTASARHGRETIAKMVTRNKAFAARLEQLGQSPKHFWIVPDAGHMGSVNFAALQALRITFPKDKD